MLMILMITQVINPLYAYQHETDTIHIKSESNCIKTSVAQALERKGLESSVAFRIASNIFTGTNVDTKLAYLQRDSALCLDSESIVESLAKRALHGRTINMDDAHSLVGLVQDIKRNSPSTEELVAIRLIAKTHVA